MKFNTCAITLFLSLAYKVYGEGYPCGVYTTIRSGDACTDFTNKLNEKYYIRKKDLLKYNPLIDCDNLKEGQKICIEPIDLEEDNSSKTGLYHIKETDTYNGIAEELGTTPEVLKRINEHTYLPELGDENISDQVGNDVIYRLDKCYEPDFSKSKEYTFSKYENTNSSSTTTKVSTTTTSTTTATSTTSTTKINITKTITKKKTTKTITKKNTKTSTTKTVTITTTKSAQQTSSSESDKNEQINLN